MAGTSFGAVNLGGSSTLTISVGLYTAINVSGNARLTMNPGIYEIAGGGFSVGGSAQVTGTGAMIYNAGSKYPSTTGGTYGAISFSGAAEVKLSAPSTGTYAGIVLFQSRDNTQALSFSGSAETVLNGLVYAPAALVSVSGDVSLRQTTLVVDELQVAGSGSAAPISTSSGEDIVSQAALAPQGPLGLAAIPAPASPGTGSGANGTSRKNGAVSTAALTSLAASSPPVATGLASGSDGEGSSFLDDSELLADVAVSLIAARGAGIEGSTPARWTART